MADNVSITPGSGVTIGSDEVTIGGVVQQVQRVKLVDGTDGSGALIPGDATNGLDVDVTRVQGTVTTSNGLSTNSATGPTALNAVGSVAATVSGAHDVMVTVVGTQASGTYTVVYEVSLDGTSWFSVYGFSSAQQILMASTTGTTTINDMLTFAINGAVQFRARCTSVGTTTNVNVTIRATPFGGPRRIAAFQANASLPTLTENQPTNAATDLTGAIYTVSKPRTTLSLFADAAAFATTEGLVSFTKVLGATATTSQTTHTVTAGKTLRIQTISLTYNIGGTTITNLPKFRLRAASSGTATASSNVYWATNLNSPTGTGAAGEGQVVCFTFPDGLEFPSAYSVALSQVMPTAAAGSFTASIVGYEY